MSLNFSDHINNTFSLQQKKAVNEQFINKDVHTTPCGRRFRGCTYFTDSFNDILITSLRVSYYKPIFPMKKLRCKEIKYILQLKGSRGGLPAPLAP